MRLGMRRQRTVWTLAVLLGLSLASLSACVREAADETGEGTAARTGLTPGRNLGIASVPNLRDLGGYKTSSGATVAPGLVYRSNQLSGIGSEDMEKLAGLELKNAYDLRTAEEREKRPEELPPGVNYVVLDVLANVETEDEMNEKSIVSKALSYGKQAYLQRRISSEASVAKLLFQNGFKLVEHRGLTGTADAAHSRARIELAREFHEIQRRLERVRMIAAASRSRNAPSAFGASEEG